MGRRAAAPLLVQLQWRQLYVEEMQPTTQIAEDYGVSVSQVRSALLRLKVTLRPPGGRSHRQA